MGSVDDLGNRIFSSLEPLARLRSAYRTRANAPDPAGTTSSVLCWEMSFVHISKRRSAFFLPPGQSRSTRIQKPSALSGSSYALLSRIFIVGTIRVEHDTKDMPCDV
jgi:hypothetical protein